MPQNTNRRRTARDGFTLVELLVVIGIIALLIGILIPVAAGVRRRGYEVRTRALIAKISAGCHAYYGDWKAYPGIFDDHNTQNPQISTGDSYQTPPTGPGGPLQGTGGNGVTSSENLVLSLLGGVAIENGAFTYDLKLVRTGPQSLNLADPKQYSAYIDVIPAELSTTQMSVTMKDSLIPEFVDGYPEPKPIIYLRARNGASGVVDSRGIENPPSDPKAADAQYDAHQVVVYFDVTTFKGYKSWADYLRNPGLTQVDASGVITGNTEVPRNKDGFLLLSAGTDRQWLSSDDIISGD